MRVLGRWAFGTVLAVAAGAIPAVAQEQKDEGPGKLSSTVSFATEYVFRGISQTDEKPAVQGSIDYSYQLGETLGSYFGIWGSNVDFSDGDEATVEIDLYAGLKPKFGSLELDVGFIAYLYPGAADALQYDYFEGKLGASYDFGFLVLSANAFASPDYFGNSGDSLYLMGGIDVPLPWGFALEGHFARQWIKRNANFGTPDYYDWHAGVRFTYESFIFALRYHDTDLKDSECLVGNPLGICDERVVFSVSRTF